MGRLINDECLSLDGAEVPEAFLAVVCRSKACSQVSKHIIMVCKTEGQQAAAGLILFREVEYITVHEIE